MANAVCGVVVLYHPDSEAATNFRTYAPFLETLYVVDNTESSTITDLELPENARVLASGDNIGVAAALNVALDQADVDGYTWLLTMDQDGSFELEQLTQLLVYRTATLPEQTLLLAPQHHPRFVEPNAASAWSEAEMVMTSGNLVHVPSAKAIGGYASHLFIDEVDHEFCLRGRVQGYHILALTRIYVNHQLGEMIECQGQTLRLYPPERVYYMLRNYLYLNYAYRTAFPELLYQRSRFLRRFFLQHLRYTPQRWRMGKMLLKGWYDYAMKRFGRLDG